MSSTPYKEFGSTSVHSCLAGCLEDGAQCATAMFNYEKDHCLLSETSQFSHPELFVKAENMDYFDKICDPVTRPEEHIESSTVHNVVVEGVTSVPVDGDDQEDLDDRVTALGLADVEEVSKAVESVMSSTSSDDL
ncbi:hypothetical protein GCK32_019029, partial [Trichostrongylus colubriformis]